MLSSIAALIPALSVTCAAAETQMFCIHPGETISVTEPADHQHGPDILFLKRQGPEQKAIRLQRIARSDTSTSWREVSEDGRFGGLVWMESAGASALLEGGSVVASQCRSTMHAADPPADAPRPASPGYDWADYVMPRECTGRPRWLSKHFGWVDKGGEWVWRSVNESWGIFSVPTGVLLSEEFDRITPDLALSATAVFAKGERRDDIDRASFVWLGGQWYADKDHVYGGCGWPQVRREIERATFEPASETYGSDTTGCFHVSGELRGCQPESFTALGGDYARDARGVWYRSVLIPDADPATFRSIRDKPGHGQDANTRYKFGYPAN